MSLPIKNSILFITIDPIEYRRRLLSHIESAEQKSMDIVVLAPGKKGQPKLESHNFFLLKRIFLHFEKGPLKFIQFNLKVFLHLLFHRYSLIQARGLWVLPAVLFIGAIKKSILIYDAHEYFPGLSIFENRPLRRTFWLWIERKAIPIVKLLITVSEPIAKAYLLRYPDLAKIEVIRNLPPKQSPSLPIEDPFRIAYSQPVILFHGYFLKHRGLENLIRAISLINNAILLLVGEGPLEPKLRQLIRSLNLSKRVEFRKFVPNDKLISFASQADIGVTLLEPVSENHRYALPNKLFEYVMAGLPVLGSNFSTIEHYINQFQVGRTVDPTNPAQIAQELIFMLTEKEVYDKWKKNCVKATKELNWEIESKKLKQLYDNLIASIQ